MARVLPFILFAGGIWFWLKARRSVSSLVGTEVELGLLPRGRQNTDLAGPDPALEHALAEARAGRGHPAAELLAATRENRDWELRLLRVQVLGEAAAVDDGWLRAWQAPRPHDSDSDSGSGSATDAGVKANTAAGAHTDVYTDADAELVRASATVARAWRLRGAGLHRHTTPEQADGFHRLLPESRAAIARAAALGPEDPSPYIVEIRTALGIGYGHEQMRALWAEITARTPHPTSAPLYAAHAAALQYWCAKWHGSEELAREFADQSVADAPAGTLMTAFPLIAWFEHHDATATARDHLDPALTALVDAALMDLAAAPADHPRLPEVRHLLAYFLLKQQRHEEALDQFRLTDGYVRALPWTSREDPAAFFCAARAKAVRGTEARARISRGA